jgi:Tubulin like
MNSNHVVIGLGGTGGKIIRALRKTIFQEFRKVRPEGVNIGYLYVDSSTDLMDLNDPTWKLLGTSVQLGENSKLVIKGANLASILDNINNFPNIKPWIGERSHWNDILNGIVGDAVGGQKRRW